MRAMAAAIATAAVLVLSGCATIGAPDELEQANASTQFGPAPSAPAPQISRFTRSKQVDAGAPYKAFWGSSSTWYSSRSLIYGWAVDADVDSKPRHFLFVSGILIGEHSTEDSGFFGKATFDQPNRITDGMPGSR